MPDLHEGCTRRAKVSIIAERGEDIGGPFARYFSAFFVGVPCMMKHIRQKSWHGILSQTCVVMGCGESESEREVARVMYGWGIGGKGNDLHLLFLLFLREGQT